MPSNRLVRRDCQSLGSADREPTLAQAQAKKSGAMAKDAEPSLDFDADAAFTRYMDRCAATEHEGRKVPQSPVPSPAAPARVQGGFGRKVI